MTVKTAQAAATNRFAPDINARLPKLVETSTGQLLPFDAEYIYTSLLAETALREDEFRASEVVSRALHKIAATGLEEITAPHIREIVCTVLSEARLTHIRNQYTRLGLPLADVAALMQSGLRENSNQDLTPESAHTWIANEVTEQYAHLELLSKEERDAHLTGRIHIHQLNYFATRPFCQAWDARIVLQHGLPPVAWEGTAKSGPAKAALVAATHLAKWLGMIQGYFGGGQGYDHFTTFLAPYLRGLPLSSADPNQASVKQVAQCFVFESNQIFAARGGQAPFTSISCEPCVAQALEAVDAVGPGGKLVGKYGDYEEEARLLFRALCEVYAAGDHEGKLFPFPKFEVKVSHKGMRVAAADYQYCVSTAVAKFGSAYFLNGLAPWIPEDIHSQCCRIIMSPEGLKRFCADPTIFDWATHYNNLGSLQSVSINLPRCGILAKTRGTTIEEELDDVFPVVVSVLVKKYRMVEEMLRSPSSVLGVLGQEIPATHIAAQPLLDLRKQSLSVGFTGLNEAVKAAHGWEIHEERGHARGREVLEHLQRLCIEASVEHHIKIALWEQPAESSSNRFARLDLRLHPGIAKNIVQGIAPGPTNEQVYYTNSAHLRYDVESPLTDIIRLQGDYHPIIQGGVITHIWLGDATPDPAALWELTRNICERTQTAYFSYSFDFTRCQRCASFTRGRLDRCPRCGEQDALDYYAKITGYYSRVSRWNVGKLAEWHERFRHRL